MRVYYDLHLHSCLSPCGDNEMTPRNLVNMAKLVGLDIIALTDHNSSKNCPAAMKAAGQADIVCIPGMELNTSEEAHVICLFETLDGAMAFDEMVERRLPTIQNNPQIFGEQIIMDEEDRAVGTVSPLLIQASDISIMDAAALAKQYGGVAFPAHIDRPSYSILASLGDIPPGCGFTAAEITASGSPGTLMQNHAILKGMPLLRNSDAHDLGSINDPGAWLELEALSAGAVVRALRAGSCRWGR